MAEFGTKVQLMHLRMEPFADRKRRRVGFAAEGDKKGKANSFNEFFATVGSHIISELKDDIESGQKYTKTPIVVS